MAFMKKRLVVAAAIGIAAVIAPAVNASAATPSPVHPDGCISPRGWYYDTITNYGKILDGKGNPTIYHNGTGSNSTLTLTQSSSGTVQWSVNGSVSTTAGFNFLAIKAGVTVTVGGAYQQSTTETSTSSVTITVPAHQFGILQGGVFRQSTYGHYYFDNGNCTTSSSQYITTKLPYPSNAFASTTNSTGTVPWDQQ